MPYPAQIDPNSLGERALAVAEDRGWDAWTLRDVARALGVTANALYRHVGDRAGLEIAIGEAAVRALRASLRSTDTPESADADADAVVVSLARRFIEFATLRPHAFTAFIATKPSIEHRAHQTWIEFWREARALVAAAAPDAPDAATLALMALLHGRVELSRRLARMSPDAGLEQAVRALLVGFRALGPVESPLPPHVRAE